MVSGCSLQQRGGWWDVVNQVLLHGAFFESDLVTSFKIFYLFPVGNRNALFISFKQRQSNVSETLPGAVIIVFLMWSYPALIFFTCYLIDLIIWLLYPTLLCLRFVSWCFVAQLLKTYFDVILSCFDFFTCYS